MTIELTLGNAITICALFIAALFALVKIIGAQQEKRLSEKFDTLGKTISGFGDDLRKEAHATRDLEKAFLEFKAELPRDYVRREDFIRVMGTIEARIDSFALRMERVLNNKFGNLL
jgi:hypothetical protein